MNTQKNLFRYVQNRLSDTLVRALRGHQPNLNDLSLCDCYGNTIYHYTIMLGDSEILEKIVKYQIPAQVKNKFGDTPYSLAIKMANEAVIKVMFGTESDKHLKQIEILKNECSDQKIRLSEMERERNDYRAKLTFSQNELKNERSSNKRNRDAWISESAKHDRLIVENKGLKEEVKLMGTFYCDELTGKKRRITELESDIDTYKKTISNMTMAMRK
jgi:hypothetical protein